MRRMEKEKRMKMEMMKLCRLILSDRALPPIIRSGWLVWQKENVRFLGASVGSYSTL